MEKNKLLLGDCLKLFDSVATDSIDLILADPPYGTTGCEWDSVIPFNEMWRELNRVAKEDTPIVLFASQPFTTHLIHSNLDAFRYCWVWDKKLAGNFASASRMPLKITEDVVVFGGKNYYPQKTKGEMRQKGGGRQFVGIYSERDNEKVTEPYWSDEYHPTTILSFPNADRQNKVHPTQKPIELMEYLVRTYSLEGDTVLDFCMGSGSTGKACLNLDRKFIGMEKNAEYFEIAKKRMSITQLSFGDW